VMELSPLLKQLAQMTFGEEQEVKKEKHALVYAQMKAKMTFINQVLDGKKWLCGGEMPTLADIYLALSQIDLQYGLADVEFLASLAHSNAHFKAVLALEQVAARVGAPKQGYKFVEPVFFVAEEPKPEIKKEEAVVEKKQEAKPA